MKKIIEYLSSYFRSETEVITKKLNSMVIDYNKLKNSNVVLNSVEPNIITSIENMEKLLKNDFLKDVIIEVPNIMESSYKEIKVLYWFTNDYEKIKDLNGTVKKFIQLSNIIIKNYEALKSNKKEGEYYKYNIRRLQPYIINIVEIRKSLLNVDKEYK